FKPSCNAVLEENDPITSTERTTESSTLTTLKPKVTGGYGKTTIPGIISTIESTSPSSTTVVDVSITSQPIKKTTEKHNTDDVLVPSPTKPSVEATSSKPTTNPTQLTTEVSSPEPTTDANDIPVTATTQSTLTTTQRSQFESSFCKERHLIGPHRSENDSTCKIFTLCYLLAGQYLELQYVCSGSSYFNQQTQNCQNEKPVHCK
ncbi:mucin-2-like, partial [Episyrphus balteatus]|uniref:mucin-2-like n=1 Tax=Episyrphus balteatus TaxID=286459 RepID=UPI00248570CF